MLDFSIIKPKIEYLCWKKPTYFAWQYDFYMLRLYRWVRKLKNPKMEKDIKYWHAMSDPAILVLLGEYIQQTRLQQNKTQQQIATAAGINRSTVVQIENQPNILSPK